MKRIFLFLLGLFLACGSTPSNAQEIKGRGQHPRLFFTPEVIAKLQERIKTEPTTAQAWSDMLANAKTIKELSLSYRMFAVSQYLLFRLAWNNVLATTAAPEISMMDKFGDYFINVSYPNSGKLLNFDFGDGGRSAIVVEPIHLLWANGCRKPRHLWLLNEAQAADRRAGQNRATPFGLVFGPGESELAAGPAAPDLPLSALYGNIGWASLRSSWDRNTTLLGVKSGYSWNHSHADAGSFVLFHRGEYLLIDSGKCTYGRPEYDGYYRQSQAHNVVLFNGEAQNPEDTYFGSKFPGTVSHLMDAGDLKYVLADARGRLRTGSSATTASSSGWAM